MKKREVFIILFFCILVSNLFFIYASLTFSSYSENISNPKGGSFINSFYVAGYWNFDADNNITSYDFSPYKNNGLYFGNAFSSTGLYGNSLYLDGEGDYVKIPKRDEYNLANHSMTFSVWFKQNSLSAFEPIITKNYSVTISPYVDYSLRISSDPNDVEFYFTNASSTDNCSVLMGGVLLDTNWHYIAVVWNGTFLASYFDGSLNSTSNCSGLVPRFTTTESFLIGANETGAYFNGSIDELMILDTDLNETQIQEIYNNQSARFKQVTYKNFEFIDVTNPVNISIILNKTQTLFNSLINLSIGQWKNSFGYNNSDFDGKNGLVSYYHFDEELNFEGKFSNKANHPLIPTYDSSNQTIHPSILYFADSWNGWKYWMGNTPYTSSNSDFENPSIFVCNDSCLSEDAVWQVPDGLVNPINSTSASKYHADIDLVYDEENDMLRAYYFDYSGDIVTLLMQNSSDGVNWNYEVETYSWDRSLEDNCRSYSIVNKSGWKMWCEKNDVSYRVQYYNSTEGLNWSLVDNVTFSVNKSIWHLDVNYIPEKNEYWMMYNTNDDGEIYFANASIDNETYFTSYTYPVMIGNSSSWDVSLYRPTFLYNITTNDDTIHLWYGALSGLIPYTGYANQTYSEMYNSIFNSIEVINYSDSIGGNNATLIGETGINSSGIYFGSGYFPGTTSSYALLGQNISNNDEGSLAFWFKASNVNTADQALLCLKEGADFYDYFTIGFYDADAGQAYSGKIKILRVNGGYISYGLNTTFASNVWYFVVISADSDEGMKVYINGEEETLNANANANVWWDDINESANWYAGIYYYNGQFLNPFKGQLDELMIFNRTLTNKEITELYNIGRANFSYSSEQNYSGLNNFDLDNTSTKVSLRSNLISGDDNFYFPLIYEGTQYTLTSGTIPLSEDGTSCTSDYSCLGGYCVHNICRSSSTHCGDGYCDTGETASTCLTDCPSTGTNSFSGIYSPSAKDLEQGYSKTFRENYEVKFEFNGEDKKVIIQSIDEDEVRISVDDKGYSVFVNSSKKVDIDNDGYYDLEISVNSISLDSTSADLEFKSIHEEVPASEQESQEEFVKDEKKSKWYFWVCGIVVIILISFVFLKFRNKKYKK